MVCLKQGALRCLWLSAFELVNYSRAHLHRNKMTALALEMSILTAASAGPPAGI